MLAPKSDAMTVDEFLAWEETQEEKWELVSGAPVLRETRLMAGGTPGHARIAANVIAALHPRLRGGPCAVYTSDFKVRAVDAVRYPDVTVDCGTDRKAKTAGDPRVVFEVLSPSNNAFVQTRLLTDYQSIETVEQIVFLNQDAPEAQVWRRAANGWTFEAVTSLDATMALPSIGADLPLAEDYEGVTFEG